MIWFLLTVLNIGSQITIRLQITNYKLLYSKFLGPRKLDKKIDDRYNGIYGQTSI